MCYISKADILTVTSRYYIVIFSLWGCVYIVIKSPHNIFKDELNCLNSLRVYQYRRAHRFSWHNYTSKIKCRAPTELLTRALFFGGRSRFSFPFLFNSSQRDLGRCPQCPLLPRIWKWVRSPFAAASPRLPHVNREMPRVHNPLGCGTQSFTD